MPAGERFDADDLAIGQALAAHISVIVTAGRALPTTSPRGRGGSSRRYPHRQVWMAKYLGILVFRLRPLPS